uniref:WAT1-related protein n=1 Tax=Chenopodium quinoa TaxID=63459 RepID=A0A803N8G3_CHEQI
MEATRSLYIRAKPFLAVIFLQIGLAGMDILSKVALNRGMSNYVLVVYRHAVATFIIAPFALVLDKPVIDQNLYYMGMKYTSATFAATMVNILPAITFLMAWIMRLEVVKCRSLRSQAKIVGTVATVGGAMMMTLVKGPALTFLSKNSVTDHGAKSLDISVHDAIKGSIMITIGCFSWAAFVILQAITLNTYPVELSLTAWICLLGTLEGTAVALVMEKGRSHVWAIGWDANLLAAVYSGVVMKERGPVFVTAFSPLCMVIVAILSTFLMAEKMYLGRVFGAIVIVVGLYMVIWGKGKDYDTHTPPLDEDKTTDQNISTQIQLQGQVEDVNNNSHWLHINQDHIHV